MQQLAQTCMAAVADSLAWVLPAQSDGGAGGVIGQLTARPPELPGPPMWEWLLLESPLIPAVSLVGAGFIALIALTRVGKGKHGLGALCGGVVLGVACYLIGTIVETDRETLRFRTQELVRAVGASEPDAAAPMLGDRVLYRGWPSPREWDRQGILDNITPWMTSAGISGGEVVEVEASLDGPNVARVQTRVRASGAGRYPLSWWRLDYTRRDGEWRVTGIEPLIIPGIVGP
ncbi:MAG: hypothetical protein AAGG07_07725 [Planctomycetota bacterium]